jgi:hypothetical protein
MRARLSGTPSAPLAWTLAAGVLLVTHLAAADDRICIQGAEKGQLLLRDHRLEAARAALVFRARDECRGLVNRDCTTWLEQATAAMPSILVTARAARGEDVESGRVLVDGTVIEGGLDGRAREVEPGLHVVRHRPACRAELRRARRGVEPADPPTRAGADLTPSAPQGAGFCSRHLQLDSPCWQLPPPHQIALCDLRVDAGCPRGLMCVPVPVTFTDIPPDYYWCEADAH